MTKIRFAPAHALVLTIHWAPTLTAAAGFKRLVTIRNRLREFHEPAEQVSNTDTFVAPNREAGASLRDICEQTGLSEGTAQRALHNLPKTHLAQKPGRGRARNGLCMAAQN